MSDQTPNEVSYDLKKILPVVGVVFIFLAGIVLLAYEYSRPRTGSIVLPNGVTYLGPSPMVQTQNSLRKGFDGELSRTDSGQAKLKTQNYN